MKPGSSNIFEVGPVTRRFTVDEYMDMHDRGMFHDQRVELLEGEVVVMPSMGNRHAQAITNGIYLLPARFGPSYTVRVQLPLQLADSVPEPDFAVVEGNRRSVILHPSKALLIIEVSDKTLLFDRTRKASIYAFHRVPDYWILNLVDDTLEVRRNPHPADDSPTGWRYDEAMVFDARQSVIPLAFPRKKIKVADLLP